MSARILVVDDEPDLEHLINQKFRKQIREQQYTFIFAQNGVQALSRLQKDPEISLILTDINMPEMDGLTLLTKIKELENPLLRPVIISAYGDMENIRVAMNRGAFDFVIKPIDLSDLEITINKSLKDLITLKDALKSHDKLIAIQQELDIATSIQTGILPKEFPAFPEKKEFDIFAQMIPAKEVGGDLYDFFLIDKHRVGFIIGDVSGKGVPAAMLMAVSKTLLKATALKGIPSDTCLETVNKILVSDSPDTMFVTIFYGILDTRNGALEYCNGGHNLPYLLSHRGEISQLENTKGTVLGWINEATFESNLIMLQPGERLFLYTDGITEAMDTENNLYDEKRLEKSLAANREFVLQDLVENVIKDVKNYSNGVLQSDDMTCLGVLYNDHKR